MRVEISSLLAQANKRGVIYYVLKTDLKTAVLTATIGVQRSFNYLFKFVNSLLSRQASYISLHWSF